MHNNIIAMCGTTYVLDISRKEVAQISIFPLSMKYILRKISETHTRRPTNKISYMSNILHLHRPQPETWERVH